MELRHFFSAAMFCTLIASTGLVSGQAQEPTAALPAQQVQDKAPPAKPSTLDSRTQRILAAQVALDRAGFSPGELDASTGNNTQRALRSFQEKQGLPATGELDERTITGLGEAFAAPIVSYAITPEDVAGPFVEKIPTDMMEKSKLPALGYSSVLELLSERFHSSPKLLQRLNPQATFERGEVIAVPNVDMFIAPGLKAADSASTAPVAGSATDAAPARGATPPKGESDAARAGGSKPPSSSSGNKPTGGNKPAASASGNVVIVTDKTKTLIVQNAAGETIFHAPVTVGSENDPLPVGEWKVNGVSPNPTFNYNPDLFWDADPSHAKAKIPAGPNNPVGVVWIDLSKEHYGIHGTPEPARVGYTESHGCIRLSNWNAMRLASLVAPGTKVILR